MASYIHSISNTVPDTSYSQDFLCRKMKEYIGDDRRRKHLIHRLYRHSGIQKRHTVIRDFQLKENGAPFYFRDNQSVRTPTTAERNDRFAEHAQPLLARVGSNLLEKSPHIDAGDITHLITVSCTGFFAPGPDLSVAKALQLPADIHRYNLGFMGCYAALPALQLADSICQQNADHRVMVISLELCTLHFQLSDQYDDLVASTLFADGAAGALVSGSASGAQYPLIKLDQFHTTYIEDAEEEMTWSIGDTGFEMFLSNYVPKIIDSNLKEALTPLARKLSVSLSEIDYWALHPGGKAIIDKLADQFKLTEKQLFASREILAEYGNMSSATILFVLQKISEEATKYSTESKTLLPLAFGPGLTIESGIFTLNPSSP